MKYLGVVFGLMLIALMINTCIGVQDRQPGDQPVLVMRADVVYPPAALAQRVEGTVDVEITVGKDGWPVAAMVKRTDNPLLTDAALDAAFQYQFKPVTKECKVTVPFVFKLKE